MNELLKKIIFSDVKKQAAEYEELYAARGESAKVVTRLGPSPTGFIHFGNLYGAYINERLAHRNDGIFYLRIEDTDSKRQVEGAKEEIIKALDHFDITFDEGAMATGDLGNYAPYEQSKRRDIYRSFAAELLTKGLAYPCFLTEDEIADIRKKQEENKQNTGIYGEYALYRNLKEEEAVKKIEDGCEYVLRLKSTADIKVDIEDGIRGKLSMPANDMDVVILKKDGMPTYHFAHVIDDHLMRTTHVIRGEEWLSTLPVHIELFAHFGWEPPIYCHTAHLMKIEDGKKRKLSKRKDPELALSFYREKGYFKEAVMEYLMTLINSSFEEWRCENPGEDINSFEFSLENMSKSGALFDIVKLNDVSKECLARMSEKSITRGLKSWANEYGAKQQGVKKAVIDAIIHEDEDRLAKMLSVGRNGNNPRKDLAYCEQIAEFIAFFFDEGFAVEDELPAEVPREDAVNILNDYLQKRRGKNTSEGWFSDIKDISERYGYALKPKEYKKNPDMYRGHVGHVSTVLRLALVGRSNSPDIGEIQDILGKEKVEERIREYLS
mgnify:FL=1